MAEGYKNKDSLLVDPDEYYAIMKRIMEGKNANLQVRVAPYMIPFTKVREFNAENPTLNFECMIYDKEITHITPKGDIYPCVLLLENKRYLLGNIDQEGVFENILRGDMLWQGVDAQLKQIKASANNSGHSLTGCAGLCESYKSDIDPRFDIAVPVCPCRTITKEWQF